jgi:DNA-binding XRE family transcriptional regulator
VPDAWEIHSADEFERSFRRLRKRYPEGADALLARLQNFMDRWLNNPQIAAGFHLPGWVHSEGRGVLAVDQGTKAIWRLSGSTSGWIIRPDESGYSALAISGANMQILHIATDGWKGSNREMAMKAIKAKAHRDVFSLAASLGYAPKALAQLRAKADETDLTAMLEARRQAAGLTQAEVARRMGVTQSTVSRLESDRWQDIRLGELDAYLRAVA